MREKSKCDNTPRGGRGRWAEPWAQLVPLGPLRGGVPVRARRNVCGRAGLPTRVVWVDARSGVDAGAEGHVAG
jgi:hypothetical protein